MASTSQSDRFFPSPAAGAVSAVGILEALNRVLADLSTRGTPGVKDEAAAALRKHLGVAAHDLNEKAFAWFMDHFYEMISAS